jgi:hypothetical protein
MLSNFLKVKQLRMSRLIRSPENLCPDHQLNHGGLIIVFNNKSAVTLAAMLAVPMFAASSPAMAGCTLATLKGAYS